MSDGDWIDVKGELNAGETRQVQIRQMRHDSITPGERIKLDPAKVALALALEYVVAWSLVDAHGRVLDVSESALNLIDPDSQREILDAVSAHDATVEARREADRKNRLSASTSPAIS